MRILVCILVALIAGCAQTPETLAPAPTPEPAAVAASGAEGEELIAAVEQAIKEGYKIRNDKGQRLFCRKDLKTGTRVRSSIKCLTEDELLAEQRGARDFVETIQRQPNRMHE